MDATCTIQDSIHVFNLVHKYVSRILGTYQSGLGEKLRNRENPPTGSCWEASGLGEKLENQENPPN